MQFLRRPRPADNELLSSFLLRLTQANGYTNYQAILDYVGIQSDLHKLNYLSKPTTNLEMLSRATDLDDSRLGEMVFPAIDDRSVRAYNSTVYGSESSNLAYFLQWVDRGYRVEYQRAGQRKNHLQRLSLISTFRNKLEDLRLVPR